MKILVDGYPFLKNGTGGVARYTLDSVRAMRKRAPESTIWLMIPKGAKFPPPIAHFCESGPKAFVARRRAGILHTSWYRLPKKLHGAKFVVTVYDWIDACLTLYSLNLGNFVKRQEKDIAAAAGVVAISEDVARRTAERTGFPRERIAVAPPFPAAVFRREPPDAAQMRAFRERTTGGAPYILHVGSRGFYKNFATILRAFLDAAPKTDRHLVIVGGERVIPDDDIFRIARAGCMERVHFLRQLSDEDLRLAYAAADAYASASHMEGFGMPIVEALACGTTPLLSDIPVYREVAGAFARYAPPVDVEAWAELFASDIVPVPGGREATLERYTADATADAILALYRSILS